MRGERKHKVDYGRPELYKFYKAEVGGSAVSQMVHSKILNEFNKGITTLITEEAYEFLVPHRIGTIRIKKYKPKVLTAEGKLRKGALKPNWKATNALWDRDDKAREIKKMVYHTNEHSDGYEYKWHFSNYRSNCANKSAYCFVPSRDNKRAITALVTNEDFTGDFYM